MRLALPPADFASERLLCELVDPKGLLRIGRHPSGEPHFARTAGNRFDDPTAAPARRFGTCYLGLSSTVAFAETVLHDEVPFRGRFRLQPEWITSRCIVRFDGLPLTLADLTGTSLKRSGISPEISTTGDYPITQAWALTIHEALPHVHGMLYMSRHVNDERAVVLFDRASTRLKATDYRPLDEDKVALAELLAAFGVDFV